MAVLLSEPDNKINSSGAFNVLTLNKNLFDTVDLIETISTLVYVRHHFTSLPPKERNSLQLTMIPDFYFNYLCHRI